jgi:hypothetical protein
MTTTFLVTLRQLGVAAVAAFLLNAAAPAARADVITIDDTSAGAIYDSILDGFPFPPPGTTPNGTGDFPGNALGVALQTGVTEERAIIELPLADLVGIAPGDVVSATLTFNIDDVVGTFGPGTTFDGTGADTIIAFGYSGNGTIELADFGNVVGAPLGVVDTTPEGIITDASLAVSGPLGFDVDVTAAIVNHLTASNTFMGVVLVTDDASSATSLDDLGNAGAGPAGVNGSFMPFLTVVTDAGEPPAFGSAEEKCQAAIAKNGGKYLKAVQGSLTKCMGKVLGAAADGDDPTLETADCAAEADPASPTSKVGKAKGKAQAGIEKACTGLLPSAINSPCDDAATTFAQVSICLTANHETQAAEAVRAAYADACAILGAVALDTAYPAVCED